MWKRRKKDGPVKDEKDKVRTLLLIMSICTAINLALYFLGAPVSFPFSAVFPQFPMILGSIVFAEYNSVVGYCVGVGVAMLFLWYCFALYAFFRREPALAVITFIIVIADTLLLVLISAGSFSILTAADLIFRARILWLLFSLLRPGKKMLAA